jgi:hypothetical protein
LLSPPRRPFLSETIAVSAVGLSAFFAKKVSDVEYVTDIKTLVENFGYDFEEHSYKTKDGYINCVHRIGSKTGPIVLYQHGFGDSSLGMCLNGRNSIAF